MKNSLLVLVGAAIGGAIGYFVFFWIKRQGFYALALPGGLLGLGAGWTKNRSKSLAVVCGLAAFVLGLVTEWQFDGFVRDDSFANFLRHHLSDREPITWLMIILGAAIGFWVPFRSAEPATKPAT